MFCPSLAMPHWTPPFALPLPTRVCHTISPFLSGSSAVTTPDFCPAKSSSRPLASFRSMAEDPKSWSGPGQPPFVVHAPLKTSFDVTCFAHMMRPVLISRATTASLIDVPGEEKLSPVVMYKTPRFTSRVGDDQTPAPEGPHCPTVPVVVPSWCGSSSIV